MSTGEMCLFMNKTIVTSIFVVLALLLSTTWDLLDVTMGWLARTIVANFQANAKKTAARKKKVRRPRTTQHSQAIQAGLTWH
mgnify:CR=1 FL=1